MRKVFGIAVAVALAMTLPAMAGERSGTIRYLDKANSTIVLDDGTRLSVAEGQMSGLSQGDNVRATYETKGERSIITSIEPTPVRPDGTVDPLDSNQSPGE
jgi:hypothetical protein